MTPGKFDLQKLVEFGVNLAANKLGVHGEVGEHIPALVSEGLGYFKLPNSIDLPLPVEILGKVMVASVRRQQAIDEAWKRHREENVSSSE